MTRNKDQHVRLAVIDELGWDPGIKASETIGVNVSGGMVTLSGFVDSYTQKYAAERGAKKLSGVIAVVDEIKVRTGRVRGQAEDRGGL